jgi:hypothetical protein
MDIENDNLEKTGLRSEDSNQKDKLASGITLDNSTYSKK